MPPFRIVSDFKPAGDQPSAIDKLVYGIDEGITHQTMLGVTGSGKTFTMANIIERTQRPTLVIAHNKTLIQLPPSMSDAPSSPYPAAHPPPPDPAVGRGDPPLDSNAFEPRIRAVSGQAMRL